jgi:hypothetical protein
VGDGECGMRNAECGMAAWPKPAEAVIGVSCGVALSGGRSAPRAKGPAAELFGSSISAAFPGGEKGILG